MKIRGSSQVMQVINFLEKKDYLFVNGQRIQQMNFYKHIRLFQKEILLG